MPRKIAPNETATFKSWPLFLMTECSSMVLPNVGAQPRRATRSVARGVAPLAPTGAPKAQPSAGATGWASPHLPPPFFLRLTEHFLANEDSQIFLSLEQVWVSPGFIWPIQAFRFPRLYALPVECPAI